MPIYEYICKDCDKHFEVLVRGTETPVCPACKSKKLEKQLSTFAVSAGGASAGDIPEPCRSCNNPAGPGACGMSP